MIVIPMGTDAPIYHWPYATVAVILLNIAMFFAVPPGSIDEDLGEDEPAAEQVVTPFERYALTLGDGLHPVQWVTHNFLHYGLLHLAGNLLFLWAFGIVVEGKLGAFLFLLMYLAIGTLHGASVQTIMLRSGLNGHAAGASAMVYGLLATCMIWAPRNELSCTIILPIGFRILVFHKELYYTTVALLYVGEQVLTLIFHGGLLGQAVVSELGHLSGATWGTAIAVLLVKLNLVDCEGWDIFSRWSKWRQLGRDWKARGERHEREKESLQASFRSEAKARKRADREAARQGSGFEDRASAAVNRVFELIQDGDFEAALAAYDRSGRSLPYWPSQGDLYAIIKSFHAQSAMVDSIGPMRDHCRRFPGTSDKMRLKLAQVLIRDSHRPIAALRVLEEIPDGSLSPDLEKSRQLLVRQAARMKQEGVLEVDGDD